MKYSTISLLVLVFTISVNVVSSQVQPEKLNLYSKGNLLNAYFYRYQFNNYAPVILLLHGWPGNAENPLGLAPKICAEGMNVFVFNYTGTWGSQGYTSLKNSV